MRSTVIFADKLLQSGFSLATKAGLSIAVDDMLIPGQKPSILEYAEEEVKEIEQQFASGLVTQGERYNKVVDIWGRAGDQVGKAMMDQLGAILFRIARVIKLNKVLQFYLHDGGFRGKGQLLK